MVEDVLTFWFGEPATDTESYGKKIRRWYMGGPTLDTEIEQRFAPLVERALAGELDDWVATIRGRLALILLLDQFPRSIWREDRESYAGDVTAQLLAVHALDNGTDRELEIAERNFLIMPLTHAEDLALQERSVVETQKLYDAAPAWQQPLLAMGLEQTRKYRDIIQRFGRFPHRNVVLGRKSTPEEEAFLVDWQAKMRPSGSDKLPA